MQKSTKFWKNIIVVWGSLFLVLGLAALTVLALTGCGHNAIQYSDGLGLEIGFIPEQYQMAVNFRYGKILSAVVKEKAEVSLESAGDFSTDLATGQQPDNAATKATTKLTLKTGDQVTGYVVDLEEAKAKNAAPAAK